MSLLSKRQRKKRYILLDDEDIKESRDKESILNPCTDQVQYENVCEKDLFSDTSISVASCKSDGVPSCFISSEQTAHISKDVSTSDLSDSSEKKNKKTVKSKKKRKKTIVEQSTNEEILAWSHLFSAENLESCEPSEMLLEDIQKSLKLLCDNQVEQTDDVPRFNAWTQLISQVVPKSSHIKRYKTEDFCQKQECVSQKISPCLSPDSQLNDVTPALNLQESETHSIPSDTLKSSDILWEDNMSHTSLIPNKEISESENLTIDPDLAMDEFNFQLNEEYDSSRQERLQRLEASENQRKKLISEHEKYRAKHLLLTTLKHLCPHYLLWTEKNRLCDDEDNDHVSTTFTIDSESCTLKKIKSMPPPCVALPFSCQVSLMAPKKRLLEEDQQKAAAELYTQWCNKTHSSRKWCLVEGFLCPASKPTNYREKFCQKLECQWLTTETDSYEWLNKRFAKEQLQKEFPQDMEYLNKLIEPSEADLLEIDSLLERIKKFRRWKSSKHKKRKTQCDSTIENLSSNNCTSDVSAKNISGELPTDLKSTTNLPEISIEHNSDHPTFIQANFTEPISVTEKKKINSLEHWLEKKTLENSTCDTDFKQDSSTCTSQRELNTFNLESPELLENTEEIKSILKQGKIYTEGLESSTTLERNLNANTMLYNKGIKETMPPEYSPCCSSMLSVPSCGVLQEKKDSQLNNRDDEKKTLEREKSFFLDTPHPVDTSLCKSDNKKAPKVLHSHMKCLQNKRKKSCHFVETYADEEEIHSNENDSHDSNTSPQITSSFPNIHSEEEDDDEEEEEEEDTHKFLEDLICTTDCLKTEFESNARQLLNEQLEEDENKKYRALFTLEGLKERKKAYEKNDVKLTRRQIARQEEEEREKEKYMQEEMELEALVEDVIWKKFHGKNNTPSINTSEESDTSIVMSSSRHSSVSPECYRFGSQPFVPHVQHDFKETNVVVMQSDPNAYFTSREPIKKLGTHVEQCHPAFSFETPEEDPFLASIFCPLECTPCNTANTNLYENSTSTLRVDSLNLTSLHDVLSLNSRSFSKRYSKPMSQTQPKSSKSFKEQLYNALLSENVLNENCPTLSPSSNVS